MSSKVFNAILEEKIDLFINSFRNTSRLVFFDDEKNRLIHSGEFGTYREKVSKEFLRFIIPQKYSISNGFIISSMDEISTQCDIIIFDSKTTPLIQSSELQTFFPVETVVAVGEIKSIMSKSDFKLAINKLSETKKIKSNILNPTIHIKRETAFNPKEILYDSIFTFIICEKLDFKLDEIEVELDSFYSDDTEYWNKHNLILSIEDGILHYNLNQGEEKLLFYAPTFKGPTTHRFTKIKEDDKYFHFKNFVKGIIDGTSRSTILHPEMVNYMAGFTAVNKLV